MVDVDLNALQEAFRGLPYFAAGKIPVPNAARGRVEWSTSGIGTPLEILSTDPGATGAVLELYHNSASPAVNDTEYIAFYVKDANGTKTQAGATGVILKETTAGAISAQYFIQSMDDGTLRVILFAPDENAVYPSTDAHWDLGVGATNRWRNGYFSAALDALTVNAGTGFRQGGVAPSGNVLRGNGTNFVSSTLDVSDLTAAWSTYSPTVTQSGTITSFSTTNARYVYHNQHTVQAMVYLTVNNAGGAAGANAITITLPVTVANSTAGTPLGTGWVFDSSTGLIYMGHAIIQDATHVAMYHSPSTVNNYLGANGFTAALATNDILAFNITYEV